jgi:hypothetical protein
VQLAAAGPAVPVRAASPGGIDPLFARVDTTDALRFARLFEASSGKPDAGMLQRGYLDGAGRGVEIFMPGRIESAENLARVIAAEHDRYAHAIGTCLPVLGSLDGEMRAVYLAFRGLLPARALPGVHIVFGAGNSGGTAAPDAQVLGLEVLCGPGTTVEAFTTRMREMFAHETVHSWQGEVSPAARADPLLTFALMEGVPDYLATLVTGRVPTPERDEWARPREALLWRMFQADRAVVRTGTGPDGSMTPEAEAARARWFGNYRKAPEGWPHEAGYWVGMRIAEAYVARAADRRAAIETLLTAADPAAILAQSGYDGGAPKPSR